MAEPVGVGVAAAQLDLQGPPKVTSGWSSSARRSKPPASMARALDVVGERWSLLVVRELLQGPRRYGELLDGLPGIATNLLAERLRSLEDSGVITRSRDDRYALTPWGKELNDVVYALGRWAAPLMARPADTDELRSHWLSHMVVARFEGVDPKRGDLPWRSTSATDPRRSSHPVGACT